MAKIKLMQLLCPRRHCLIALAFDEETTTRQKAIELLKEGIRAMQINRHCGLCGSVDLTFETGATEFTTMAEASVALVEEEKKNLAALRRIHELRRQAKNN